MLKNEIYNCRKNMKFQIEVLVKRKKSKKEKKLPRNNKLRNVEDKKDSCNKD
jgi:hypothetical protein